MGYCIDRSKYMMTYLKKTSSLTDKGSLEDQFCSVMYVLDLCGFRVCLLKVTKPFYNLLVYFITYCLLRVDVWSTEQ